ncbi:MAG: DUF1588 domain-containing protein [Pirellulales bacterium]
MRALASFVVVLALTAGVRPCVAEALPKAVGEFLAANCLGCHDAATKSADICLEFTDLDWTKPETVSVLERMHRAVSKGEMPPPDEERPPADATRDLLAWLDDGLVHKVPQPGTKVRRLSRDEYRNTLRGSFGLVMTLPGSFPEDTRSHGFDNVAESLVMSPSLLESYADYAVVVADQFFRPAKPPAPPPTLFRASMAEMSVAETPWGPAGIAVDGGFRLPHAGVLASPEGFAVRYPGRYRIHVKAAAVRPITGGTMTLEFKRDGSPAHVKWKTFALTPDAILDETFEDVLKEDHILRVMFTDAPNSLPDFADFGKALSEQMAKRFARSPRLLAAWLAIHEEVTAPNGKSKIYKLRMADDLDAAVKKPLVTKLVREALARPDLDLAQATPENAARLVATMVPPRGSMPNADREKQSEIYMQAWLDQTLTQEPAIDLIALEIEGPFENPEEEKAAIANGLRMRNGLLGGPLPAEADESIWLPKGVGTILSKSFRRPATPEELDAYVTLARDHRAAGHSLEESLHLVLRTALMSPQFIYRERHDGGFTPYDLASRLSYFLTQMPPDGALLTAADDGSLAKPEVLRAQAERLLGSPLVGNFLGSFVHQWLGTRVLGKLNPDPRLGPFNEGHRVWMLKETEEFAKILLQENRPLTDFIDPDFTFTTVENAKFFYDLDIELPKDVKPGYGFRTAIPRGGRAGGLLGQAAVLMATANGVDTQPVTRGKFVLENIVGDPPPPPPPSVPALTPDTQGAKTIREMMAKHTSDPSCAGCHRRLDPFGYVLESYDAIGRYRDHYPVFTVGKDGKTVTTPGAPVDSVATVPDGTTITNAVEMKQYLVAHIDDFAGCLAEKLFLYGAGRVPTFAERKALHAAADKVVADKGGFRDLILAVIATEEFRTK